MCFVDFLAVSVFFAEVFLLAFAEKKIWKSLITPLNCLMLPYAAVVGVCICISGRMGYPPFNFSTLWVYAVGLFLFFIPSCFFGFLYNRRKGDSEDSAALVSIPGESILKSLEWLTGIVLVLFLIRFLWLAYTSPVNVGSDAFGEQFAAHGFFGHLFNLLMVLGIIWIFLFDLKERRRYGIYILGFIVAAMLYQVKGWFFIPVIGALCLRILAGKTKFSWKICVGVLLLGFCVFFVTYWLNMYILGSDVYTKEHNVTKTEYAPIVLSIICKHFITYLTAGVYGFSQDMSLGILETVSPEKIFTPFVNIYNFFTGNPMTSNFNDVSVQVSGGYTNVRSFMGTLYVFLGSKGAVLFTFAYSFVSNGLFFVARRRGGFFLWIIVAWMLGVLAFGWFDLYVQLLTTWEVPVLIFCLVCFLYCFPKIFTKKNRQDVRQESL